MIVWIELQNIDEENGVRQMRLRMRVRQSIAPTFAFIFFVIFVYFIDIYNFGYFLCHTSYPFLIGMVNF
jgi:hypothetical protein